jgi:glycine/D-amino acid oxidase-like deaminating enzyme
MVAAGHGRNGVLLAPMTAQIVADLFLGKEDSGSAYARWLAPRSGSAVAGARP